MARSSTRDYTKNDNPFGTLVAHHEQSETVEAEEGGWKNVYGRKTPQAGQQLPDTPTYDTVDEAVEAAKKRSEDYGRDNPEHSDEEEE